jgi:hypothetical protein
MATEPGTLLQSAAPKTSNNVNSLRAFPIIVFVFTSLLACSAISPESSHAQQQSTTKLRQPPQQQLAQNGQPQQSQKTRQLMVPSDDVLLILIRASLIALHQANVTGNYTVLRDMGAPGFKQANSTDKLAKVFANRRNLDLAPILVIQPKLFRKAEITSAGMLRITGFFPTDPERITFDLLFQPVQGQWRLFGISISTVPSQRASVLEVAPQAAPTQAPEAAAPAKAPEVPRPANTSSTATKNQGTDVDIRDRLDNPPSPPPEDEKPTEKSFWNPFDR